MTQSIESLNQMSLKSIHSLFAGLEPPERSSLIGVFRGIFIGPGWLRLLWGPILAVTGLGGWWGKEIDPRSGAINLVYRKGNFERKFPMVFIQQSSYLDQKPGLALRYQPHNPFPWPLIVDELRRIDQQMVLGMTLADVPPFRRMAFPFILQSREAVDGL